MRAIGYVRVSTEEQAASGAGLAAQRHELKLWARREGRELDVVEDAGVPKGWAKMVRAMGADVLVGDLKSLGLTRLFGASKLNQLGMKYAQLGVFLRMAQTDDIPDDLFSDAVGLRREIPDRPWQLDEA